jgi:ketopantoate reductase
MGSGVVGGYLGARLAEAGEAVHFIARGEHLAAMRTRAAPPRVSLGERARPMCPSSGGTPLRT